MCFSATASFAASSVLLPAGVYAIAKAAKKDKRHIFPAVIPVFFAVQQAVEGIIWVYFGKGMPASAKSWSYVYLFFVVYWPFFIALCAYAIENEIRRKKILYWFVWGGAIFGAIYYLAFATDLMPFDISVVAHSISYKFHAPAWLLVLLSSIYAALVGMLPSLVSTVRWLNLIGIMWLFALLASSVWYIYAFTSVWCFFAAVIAIYIAWVMKNLGVQSKG
jgi:uncharacterized protein DUF6629